MGHVSHKLSTSMEGALAGGGDPATSPLYVFGPFLKLIVVAGVAGVTFGASLWMVVFTIITISLMYRLVMSWVVDGSGGSGLTEEEFGGWAVKINASITLVEYTLTFLVSMAALVTFMADRFPVLNETFLGFQFRTYTAIGLSILTGWLVNRGPKTAARAFGPATAGVLILLWLMIIATVWRQGLQLPNFDLRAFSPQYLGFTFGGYARILAVMTGIEIFANLVAAYDGPAEEKSRKAFGSLVIIMGTTGLTMLVVGPAILALSDPTNESVSVFTQTMDQLLPAPLPWLGTIVGIAVLLSASAASAQGIQNLALGLKYRNYVPAVLSQRNRFDVAPRPVWLEVFVVALCFLLFGTNEETYLALYAAGVFILLSMTGWAAAKRLNRELREDFTLAKLSMLLGTIMAAVLTSGAIVIIFEERFLEGAWAYLVLIPVLYVVFTFFRNRLGEPTPVEEKIGLMLAESKYLYPFQRAGITDMELSNRLDNILVPLDGSIFSERILSLAENLARAFNSRLTMVSIEQQNTGQGWLAFLGNEDDRIIGGQAEREAYLRQVVNRSIQAGIEADYIIDSGSVTEQVSNIATDIPADLIAMSTHGRSGLERAIMGSVANAIVQSGAGPLLLMRPTGEWRSRWSQFRTLLVTLDGSSHAEKVLPYVELIASAFESEVLLLSVPEGVESPQLRATTEHYLEGISRSLEASGLRVQALVTGNAPGTTIIDISQREDIDLVMLATAGRGGLDRLMLGSVADRVVSEAACPVFLVPIHREVGGAPHVPLEPTIPTDEVPVH